MSDIIRFLQEAATKYATKSPSDYILFLRLNMDKLEPKLRVLPRKLANRIRIAIMCEADPTKNADNDRTGSNSSTATAASKKSKLGLDDSSRIKSLLDKERHPILANLPSYLLQRIVETESIFERFERTARKKIGKNKGNDDDDDDNNKNQANNMDYKSAALPDRDQATRRQQEEERRKTTAARSATPPPSLADAKSGSRGGSGNSGSGGGGSATGRTNQPSGAAVVDSLPAKSDTIRLKFRMPNNGVTIIIDVDKTDLVQKGYDMVEKFYGEGSFSVVIGARRIAPGDNEELVMKIGKIEPREYALSIEASKLGFGIPVYAYGLMPVEYTNFPPVGKAIPYMVMAKADMTLEEFYEKELYKSWTSDDLFQLADQLSRHFAVMREVGFRHNDCKPDNILLQLKDGIFQNVYVSDYTTATLDKYEALTDYRFPNAIGWPHFIPYPGVEPDYENVRNFLDMAALIY
ncbi:MAG: hypothetical protein QXI19_09915, partial [Candidatus Caldarchaeum sp.]